MGKTIAQQLNVKEFPFTIKDSNNNQIYFEDSRGFWWKCDFDDDNNEIYYENSNDHWWKKEYDSNDNQIYYENSNDHWWKKEYDSNDNEIYYEDYNGFWGKSEFDDDNNEIYYENSKGNIRNNKVIVELTLDEIAEKLNINVKNLETIKQLLNLP